jgi:hypothetical protein
MEMVTLGRRQIAKDDFVKAIQSSDTIAKVCDNLGFNNTVGTTRQYIRKQIDVLGIDISHFKYQGSMNQDFAKAAEKNIKHFNLSADNQQYYDAFEQTIVKSSWATYKATIGNFLEQLSSKDFATVTVNEIVRFVGNRTSADAHLRSLMIFIVSNDINNAKQKVNKDMLIWLISNRAKV